MKKHKNKRGHPTDPSLKFRRMGLAMAKEALENALVWTKKKDAGWALVEAQRAVKLLEVSR